MKLVVVGLFPSVSEATLAKDLLQQQGIESCLAGSVPQNPGMYGEPLGCVIQVPEEDATRATEILQRVRRVRRTTHAERFAKPVPRWMLVTMGILFTACVITFFLMVVSAR